MFGSANDTRFAHPALFYRSDADYRTTIAPFVMNGLDLGQPVAVAVPGPRLRLVRDALGTTARDVTMLDMTYEGRNPGRIIAQVLHRFADRHPDQHVRIVGESVWPGRTPTEYPACVQHEALVNAAFAGRSATILCLYDATALDAETLTDAHVTHSSIWADGGERPSTTYAPEAILHRYNLQLGVPEADAFLVTTTADVRLARRFAADHGRRFGLTDDRVRDLSLIVTELVTNSIVHTPGPGRLAVWQADGHVVCEVRDGGRIGDPLAGRRPADRCEPGGRGLLLVNDLADLVRVHTGPEGTVIRAFLRV